MVKEEEKEEEAEEVGGGWSAEWLDKIVLN